jgi:hypothetical protein
MAEQSYLFDFRRTDDFFENFNVNFSLSDMYIVIDYNEQDGSYVYVDGSGGANYELVIVTKGGANLEEYLDDNSAYSKLDESTIGSENIISKYTGLDWYNRGNGEATIELHGNVTFNIGDMNVPIKAVFLRDKDSLCVMGYSINTTPFSVTNEVVFDDDVIFWDISRFNQ